MSSIVRTVTLMFTAREPGTDGPATSDVVSDTRVTGERSKSPAVSRPSMTGPGTAGALEVGEPGAGRDEVLERGLAVVRASAPGAAGPQP